MTNLFVDLTVWNRLDCQKWQEATSTLWEHFLLIHLTRQAAQFTYYHNNNPWFLICAEGHGVFFCFSVNSP